MRVDPKSDLAMDDLFGGLDLGKQGSRAPKVKPRCASPKDQRSVPAAKTPSGSAVFDPANERYLTDQAVADRFGVARQTIWRWASRGDFPQPIILSLGTTRWRLSDLLSYEASLGSRKDRPHKAPPARRGVKG